MKIISKFKDYYDYLQGIWGVDEKRVLDRTKFEARTTSDAPFKLGETVKFYICDIEYHGIFDGTKFIYGDELLPYVKDIDEKARERWWDEDYAGHDYYIVRLPDTVSGVQVLKKPRPVKPKFQANEKENCAILKVVSNYYKTDYIHNPVLKTYNLASILPPQDIWMLLSDWLGKEKEIPNNQTDKDKILAAGFDLKSSFRKDKQKK